VFLVQKLGYSWGEVHDIAEQLEHVRGESLEMRLDAYLKWPRVDPHGDPIPDAAGRWEIPVQQLLSEVGIGSGGVMTGVKDHRVDFLDYLERLGLRLGVFLEVVDRLTFDGLVQVRLGDAQVHWLSGKVCSQVYLTISNHG
jgi:DtxR family Mn-dependent transcriptional regulator